MQEFFHELAQLLNNGGIAPAKIAALVRAHQMEIRGPMILP
jgi:hypothetical protein